VEVEQVSSKELHLVPSACVPEVARLHFTLPPGANIYANKRKKTQRVIFAPPCRQL